ncbi:MAG: hypothetical protein ACFFAY_13965 [Promethearchaeota archaeon]
MTLRTTNSDGWSFVIQLEFYLKQVSSRQLGLAEVACPTTSSILPMKTV